MQFNNAKEFILNRLRSDLADHLSYHNIEHTEDVYQAASQIGAKENVSEKDMQLLLTAACYHDSGYLFKTIGHEEESCRIARDVLGEYEYSQDEINRICGMMMATRLPQSPGNLLEEIIADADLDYLGRDDFFSVSAKLFKELMFLGVVYTEEQWDRMQVAFLESHHYFTKTAISMRMAKKNQHLEQIKAKLK